MPNKNYISGRRKEYKIMEKLRIAGYETLRTAGSHGFADIIAIDKKNKLIKFVQCKPDNFPASQEKKLMEEQALLFNKYMCSFEVV